MFPCNRSPDPNYEYAERVAMADDLANRPV